MRGSVAVLVAAAVLSPLVGCSGARNAATPPAAAISQSAQATATTSASANLSTNASVPVDLRTSLSDGRPVLVFLFKEGASVSKADQQVVEAVLSENEGLVDSFSYEINSNGAIALAGLLGVSDVPSVVLIDRAGSVVYLRSGLIDQEFLQRELYRAAR